MKDQVKYVNENPNNVTQDQAKEAPKPPEEIKWVKSALVWHRRLDMVCLFCHLKWPGEGSELKTKQ